MREEFEKNDNMPSKSELKRQAKLRAEEAKASEAKAEQNYQQQKKNLCQPFFDDPQEFITKFYLGDTGRTQLFQFQLLTTMVNIQKSLEQLISVLKSRK